MPELNNSLSSRLKHAWNAFRNKDPTMHFNLGYGSSARQDAVGRRFSNERSIIISVYNKIALDVACISIKHVRLDENGMFEEEIDSGLNYALSVSANADQGNITFMHDVVMSMFDEGVVCIVPIDTTLDPAISSGYDIHTLRVGRIITWYPKHVRVKVYDENTGLRKEIVVLKENVAIIENPFYAIMNEPNSTLQRLIRKLSMLDTVDEQSSSGRLDLIMQLPYVIKSETRRQEAEKRRKDIEVQLSGSKYGIAYVDATEKVTQLNRPAENHLMTQIQYLTSMLYSQLGITEEVFNGTANEAIMLNYINQSVIPILDVIVNECKRKFLTKTARTQKQSIMYFRNVFSLVPVNELATIADKFTRNEILSSNEIRSIIGYKPSDQPGADELRNKNLNKSKETIEEHYIKETKNKNKGET